MASTPSRLTSDNLEQLRTTGSGGGGGAANITQVAGNTIAATPAAALPVELFDGTNPLGVTANPLTSIVRGPDTNGNPASSPSQPVQAGGVDTGGNARRFTLSTSGELYVVTASNLPVNEAAWGGVAVQAATNTATDGTGINPTVRSIIHRYGVQLTTTPLAANGTYTSAWFDTNQTGDCYVMFSVRSDVAGANPAIIVDFTDDTSNALFFFTSQANAQVFAATTGSLGPVGVTMRYWRVRYVNGATPQTTFELNATSYSDWPFQSSASANAFQSPQALIVQANAAQASFPDGISTSALLSPVGVKASSSFGQLFQGVVPYLYNGTTWDRERVSSIFKTASIAATATGNTAVWTPAAGKKFRLQKFQITAQGLAATASGVVTVSFQDATTGITIGTYDVNVPAVASVQFGVMQISGAWIDLGSGGILSALANNVLNFNISAAGAGTVGTYRVNCCGTEE